MPDLEANKANVIAFYELMFNDNQPAEATARYTGATYIQHNPEVPDGKQGFIDYFERMKTEYPGKRVEVLRAVAEGNLVVVHTRQLFPPEDWWVSMDLFRIDDAGKIVEHW